MWMTWCGGRAVGGLVLMQKDKTVRELHSCQGKNSPLFAEAKWPDHPLLIDMQNKRAASTFSSAYAHRMAGHEINGSIPIKACSAPEA